MSLSIPATLLALLAAGCSSSPSLLQWEATGGPYGQNITSLTVDEDNPLILYAGLSTGAVCRSPDKGQTWVRYAVIDSDKAIYSLLQHPEQTSLMYAATDGGLYTSSNSGRDWRGIRLEKDTVFSARVIRIDPFKTSVLYVGTPGRGIYRSSDGGSTWTHCKLGIGARQLDSAVVNDVRTEPLRPDVVYAAISGVGLLKSSDAGESWSLLMKGVMYSGTNVTTIVLQRRQVGVLCAGTDDGSIYKSSNGGASWTLCRSGRGKDGVLSLSPSPLDPEIIYAGTGSGALISPDFGASWKDTSPDLSRSAHSIVISQEKPVPSLYAFGEGVGLRTSSDNGRTWLRIDNQLGGSSVTSIISSVKGDRVYATAGSAVYTYHQELQSWEFAGDGLIGGTISSIVFDADSGSTLYAGTSNGPFRTVDGGKLWQPLTPAMRFNPIQFIDTHPSIGTRLFASTDRGIQVSTDRGATWSYTKPYNTTCRVRSLTFSPRNAGRIFGATLDKGVIASDDGGLKWSEAGSWQADNAIEAVTLDAADLRTLYAWTRGGDSFRSTDNGKNWSKHLPPWKPGDHLNISFDRRTPSSAVALVNNQRLFYTLNGGGTWLEVAIAPLPGELLSLCWNQKTSMLYAGTKHSGVFQVSLLASVEKSADR